MKFTNLSRRDLYFQCCHREVEPGGSFFVPWSAVEKDRAVRAAMQDGVLGWESADNEPEIPGSPHVPTAAERAEAAEAAERAKRERVAKAAAAERANREEDNRNMRRNMAKMGRFNLPKITPNRKPDYGIRREKPVTQADIIRDDRPKSLAEIMRHNRAIKIVERAKGGNAGDAGSAGKRENENQNSNQQDKEQ